MVINEKTLSDIVAKLVASHAHSVGLTPLAPDKLKSSTTVAVQALRAKDAVRRFTLCTTMLSELLEQGPGLVQGSITQRLEDWNRCASSVVALWLTAANIWKSGSYAVATALSITCLEETGKLTAERLRLFGAVTIRLPANAGQHTSKGPKKLFVNHSAKHVLAAMSGALINSRLDRVLGIEFVIKFLDDVEAGHLERFRQSCLYLDREGDVLHIPAEQIAPEQAAQYVALSGEVLAEIQPEPGAWSRLLERVKEFERLAGIDAG